MRTVAKIAATLGVIGAIAVGTADPAAARPRAVVEAGGEPGPVDPERLAAIARELLPKVLDGIARSGLLEP